MEANDSTMRQNDGSLQYPYSRCFACSPKDADGFPMLP